MTADGLWSRTFEAVLFDMDGTLINSIPAVVRSWTRWAGEFGVPAATLVAQHGVPAADIVAALLPRERWAEGRARIVELEENDVAGIELIPGAVEALRALPAGRAAIATSCTRGLAAARLAATALPVPDVVVVAEDTTRGKPDPAPYLLAARRLGADPANCLVVEDATSGVQSGRSAGCAVLAVLTHLDPGGSGADAEVADLAAVQFTSGPAGVRVRRR